jgi:hypothetical protein
MKKKYRHNFTIKAETAARLACLSTDMDISMSSVIDRLVENEWSYRQDNDYRKMLQARQDAKRGNLPQPQTDKETA